MRTSETRFVLRRWKKFFLILGLSLLVAGFSLIIIYSSSLIKPNTVFVESVNVTGAPGDYYSSSFQAMKGDWIKLNLASTNKSWLMLNIDTANDTLVILEDPSAYSSCGNEATHVGANYTDTVLIDLTASYYLELRNLAYQVNQTIPTAVPVIYDNNTFSGSFCLMRMPNYYPYLLLSGGALLAASCSFLLIPTLSYFRFQAKRLGINLARARWTRFLFI